jgi:hypothetical protein
VVARTTKDTKPIYVALHVMIARSNVDSRRTSEKHSFRIWVVRRQEVGLSCRMHAGMLSIKKGAQQDVHSLAVVGSYSIATGIVCAWRWAADINGNQAPFDHGRSDRYTQGSGTLAELCS